MIVEIFMASLHFYILYQAGYHAYSLRFLLDVWFPLELFFFFGGGDALGGTIAYTKYMATFFENFV